VVFGFLFFFFGWGVVGFWGGFFFCVGVVFLVFFFFFVMTPWYRCAEPADFFYLIPFFVFFPPRWRSPPPSYPSHEFFLCEKCRRFSISARFSFPVHRTPNATRGLFFPTSVLLL